MCRGCFKFCKLIMIQGVGMAMHRGKESLPAGREILLVRLYVCMCQES